ncbi:MAG TPA: hypothetical protein VGD69_18575 [Herpetosiphonaceae bacterium]
MTNGICPKCSATQVYSFVDQGDQQSLQIWLWTLLALTYYVCAACGYVEQYILDNKHLEHVRTKAVYVEPQQL